MSEVTKSTGDRALGLLMTVGVLLSLLSIASLLETGVPWWFLLFAYLGPIWCTAMIAVSEARVTPQWLAYGVVLTSVGPAIWGALVAIETAMVAFTGRSAWTFTTPENWRWAPFMYAVIAVAVVWQINDRVRAQRREIAESHSRRAEPALTGSPV